MERSVMRNRTGFTLIEVIVVLAVVAALTAILTPTVVRYVEDAKVNRARSDVKVVGSSVAQFFRDVGRGPVFSSSTNFDNGNPDIEVLHGPGLDPVVSGSVTGWPTSGGSYDATATSTDAIADQLIANTDGSSDIYPTSPPPGTRTGQGAYWQGPYLDAVDADPWGQRYLLAVRGFGSAPGEAAFAVSAGANGQVETDGDQAQQGELTVGGDDIAFRIR